MNEYKVIKAGRIQRIWREAGETIALSPVAAKYLVMTGQIEPVKAPVKKTGKGK